LNLERGRGKEGKGTTHMTTLAVLALLWLQAPSPPTGEIRALSVTITDDKGDPVESLAEEDVAVLENGVAREVQALVADRRPLTLALLVDTSAAVQESYRLNMVEPLLAFLGRLPSGSSYAVWTTGDRPTKLLDYTDDVAAARKALTRIAPQGGSTLLDALVEASEDLKKKEGERTAVVAVSALGVEFSNRDRFRVAEEAGKNAGIFLSALIEEGSSDAESRVGYEYVLTTLARKSGGLAETTLSSMGLDSALKKLSAHLKSQYRLTYATPRELKGRKVEVKVARPGVKVRVSAAPTVVQGSSGR
jgi:VWFA-related protein